MVNSNQLQQCVLHRHSLNTISDIGRHLKIKIIATKSLSIGFLMLKISEKWEMKICDKFYSSKVQPFNLIRKEVSWFYLNYTKFLRIAIFETPLSSCIDLHLLWEILGPYKVCFIAIC